MIPDCGGTYALLLFCRVERQVRIGRLGRLRLTPGWYVYVGSAFGPGGLRARIGHHRKAALRPHWHIDYLRRLTTLAGGWFIPGLHCEHEWAELLRRAPGAELPLRGFGSSDCGCAAHLFQFEERPTTAMLRHSGVESWAVASLPMSNRVESHCNLADAVKTPEIRRRRRLQRRM